ncbi:50S ribosomal protein L25 [uncultured Desulfobacterium sp.]|uniref:Large ribosomal subunit protein bL25 n=1 Tax=uncultured Desulfobacterium sp. TaxID=201089 RepID=A0A445MUN9_9BACT|nr:50S ribosomal protein L25 [uncultured Desulfobacterium sp.]
MEQAVLAAEVRKIKGKGAARRLRRDNKIPAIFYGPKAEPIMLAVDYPELKRVIMKSASETMILDLEVKSDQGTETRKVMIKELMTDPVKDAVLHADFYEISMDKEITVDVPLRFVGSPEGVTQGGILQHVRREMTISCLPDKLIDFIEVDVSGLKIGDALRIEDIALPDGIVSVDGGRLAIAVVNAPSVKAEAEEEEGEEGETTPGEEAGE